MHKELVEPAIVALREAAEFDAASLQAALEQEERRVEDAALVADLILPFLSTATSGPGFTPAEPAVKHAAAVTRTKPAAGNVAAFIDDMLAQSAPSPRR